jgi:hypothetical protein
MKYAYCLMVFVYAAALLVTGCSVPVSQKELKDVQSRYRPKGEKPTLPELTPESPLSDFITYALLNSPNVEASFYSWKEAVQQAVVAGAFPDPELIFSAKRGRT